jgi:dienelactone hydrolase
MALVVLAAVEVATGCGGPGASQVRIDIDHPVALADVPLHVLIVGLAPAKRVTLVARTTDQHGAEFESATPFAADGRGTVDLATAQPLGGTYKQPDPMGFLWSMVPSRGDAFYVSPVPKQVVSLTVRDGDRTLATGQLMRIVTASGGAMHTEKLGEVGFSGVYLAARASTQRRPAVLAFGGSEGGLSPYVLNTAELLASHGYPTLAIAYFGASGLPPTLLSIPLEYFAGAITWLRRQPGVDPGRVLTYGVSRGSEAALLLGVHYPDQVHGVVALVPSNVAICSYPGCTGPAWTLKGGPLPYTRQHFDPSPTDDPAAVIPVERIAGPMFLVCGGSDRTWVSCPYAQAIVGRLDANHVAYPHVLLSYPEAGHGVGDMAPYQPGSTLYLSGSSPAANPLADAQAWPALLAFLAGLG